MSGFLGMLANGAKAMTGSQSGVGGFFGGMQNLDKISGAFGGKQEEPMLLMQKQQMFAPNTDEAPLMQKKQLFAPASTSTEMVKNSAWDDMMKKLMEAKQQNALGSWLGR